MKKTGIKENVVISVYNSEESAQEVLHYLNTVLDDFKPVCGIVAELKCEKNVIIASYVQSDHWGGFLTGCSYVYITGIRLANEG